MQRRKTVLTAKIGYIVVSAALCVLGVIMMIFPDVSAIIMCRVIGATLCLYGIIKMIGFFSNDLYSLAFQYDLAFGILMGALGVIMLIKPESFISVLYFIIGMMILANGLFRFQISFDAKKFGLERWYVITLIAAISCVFGLLLMIDPFKGVGVVTVLTGVAIVISGILDLIVVLYSVRTGDARKKYIETEFREDEEK